MLINIEDKITPTPAAQPPGTVNLSLDSLTGHNWGREFKNGLRCFVVASAKTGAPAITLKLQGRVDNTWFDIATLWNNVDPALSVPASFAVGRGEARYDELRINSVLAGGGTDLTWAASFRGMSGD